MKNILRAILLLTILLEISSSKTWAQTYTMKKPVSEQSKKELYEIGKQLFEPSGSLEYTITTSDLLGTFEDMPKGTDYNMAYKQLQEDQLTNTPTNSVLWNNLGNYYNANEDKINAKKSFQKAYDFLDLTFSQDSAIYHSIKGVLQLNLGLEGYMEELERAAQIDPNDSLVMTFLPIMLLNKGEYAKAKTYCSNAVENSTGKAQGTWYTMFFMADFFEQFNALQTAENGQEQLRNKNYTEVFDLSQLNAMYEKYKTNQTIANARLMSDILIFIFKLSSFDLVDGKFKLNYTKAEVRRLEEIKGQLIAMKDKGLINEFSRVKNLAFIALIQGKNDVAIKDFEESIKLFPEGKDNEQFSSRYCYNALYCIYSLRENIQEEKLVIERMIKTADDKSPNPKYFADMAKCYLQEGNYDQMYEWALKGYMASATDFETLRLLIHYNFYKEEGNAANEYFKNAVPLVSTEAQNYDLSMQLAIYQLVQGEAARAHDYIKGARDTYPDEPCELCDELEKKYILETK